MKLALVAFVSMLTAARASACPDIPYSAGSGSYQSQLGGATPEVTPEVPIEQRDDQSWIVWLSLLGLAAAAVGVCVRPRIAE